MGRPNRRSTSRSYDRSSYSRSRSRSYSDDSRRSDSYSDRSRSSSASRSSRSYRSYSRSSRSRSRDSGSSIHDAKPKRPIQEEWSNNKPCKHVFCHKCAMTSSKTCGRCGKDVEEIDRCVVGRIFMCTENSSCCRTYLSEADLDAHVKHRHRGGISNPPAVSSTAPQPSNVVNAIPEGSSYPTNMPPQLSSTNPAMMGGSSMMVYAQQQQQKQIPTMVNRVGQANMFLRPPQNNQQQLLVSNMNSMKNQAMLNSVANSIPHPMNVSQVMTPNPAVQNSMMLSNMQLNSGVQNPHWNQDPNYR